MIVIDLPSDRAAKLREEQLSHLEVKKIIDAFESKDDLDLINWTSRGCRMVYIPDIRTYRRRRESSMGCTEVRY